MRKGGYTIIDLKDKALTTGGSAVTIAGLYEQIEGNYRKRIVLSGLNLDTAKLTDREVEFTLSGTDFIGIVKTVVKSTTVSTTTTITAEYWNFKVTSADAVTVTKLTVTSA